MSSSSVLDGNIDHRLMHTYGSELFCYILDRYPPPSHEVKWLKDIYLEPSLVVQNKHIGIILRFPIDEYYGITVAFGARQWNNANMNNTKQKNDKKTEKVYKHSEQYWNKDLANIWNGIFKVRC